MTNRFGVRSAAVAAALTVFAAGGAQAQGDSTWDYLAASLFDERPMIESGIVTLDAPYRAEDAAVVPMTIHTQLPEGDTRKVERITLVIDENPVPLAAAFELGPKANVTEISTRVRVNAYSPVHVVAELSDGSLHVTERFVKASGGCAAPMGKDPEQAMASLGKMKLRWLGDGDGDGEGAAAPQSQVAQLMIRHPNNSGFQMDQLTRFYIPAHFVQDVTIMQGDDLVLRMEGGISISEDPNFRFEFESNGAPLRVKAVDTEDGVFSGEWAAESS